MTTSCQQIKGILGYIVDVYAILQKTLSQGHKKTDLAGNGWTSSLADSTTSKLKPCKVKKHLPKGRQQNWLHSPFTQKKTHTLFYEGYKIDTNIESTKILVAKILIFL